MKVFIGDPCYMMTEKDYFEMLGHSYWADDFDDGTINHPFFILSSSDNFDEEDMIDEMWESGEEMNWTEDSSVYPHLEGKVINAVKRCSTWIGDGCYGDQFGRAYHVASGQLGIVPSHMWKDDVTEERLNCVGRVYEMVYNEEFFVYDKKASGTIQIADFTIITGPADGNGDYIEEDVDS